METLIAYLVANWQHLLALLALIAASSMVVGAFMVWRLWVLFLAVMHLQDAKEAGALKGAALRMGRLTLYWGLAWDFLVQMTVANLIWLERPRETTVSARVARLVQHGSGWRQRRALWWRTTLLAPFDKSGGHG